MMSFTSTALLGTMQVCRNVVNFATKNIMTPSEICIIFHIIRKPNSTVVLLFIQNISRALSSVTNCKADNIQ